MQKGKPQRTQSKDSRYLHTHVHSSFIHKSQAGGGPQVPINNGWISKVWSAQNGILLSLKKEGNSDTCYYMDEP